MITTDKIFGFEPSWSRERYDGVHYHFYFDNGYGASVIRHMYSYGFDDGLWELAVLVDEHLCYDTEITDVVIGYLTEEEVEKLLNRIKDLSPMIGE